MVHCPECGATFDPNSDEKDVKFVDMGTRRGVFQVPKRFYVTVCADCGVAIGTGVAGGRG